MARQPDRPPPPPVVQRLRIRYAKRDRMRFTSHRDVARALERALRRAELPVAHSAGLSPPPQGSHPRAAPPRGASGGGEPPIRPAPPRGPRARRPTPDAAPP